MEVRETGREGGNEKEKGRGRERKAGEGKMERGMGDEEGNN